jgi:hypothetical protein
MKFKTLRTSETGKKFKVVEDKLIDCISEMNTIKEKYGATTLCGNRWAAIGGCEILIFDQTPDLNIWKKTNEVKNGYTPRLNTKKGKEIAKEFKNVKEITKHELNMCINYDEDMFNTIGFSWSNSNYYLFSAKEEWGLKIPDDCIEITITEYNSLCDLT